MIPGGLYPADELAALREMQLEGCRDPRGTPRAETLARVLAIRERAIADVRSDHPATFASGNDAANVLAAIDAAFARLKPAAVAAIERAASAEAPRSSRLRIRQFGLRLVLRTLSKDLLPILREFPQAPALILAELPTPEGATGPDDSALMWGVLIGLTDVAYAARVRMAIDAPAFRERLARSKPMALVGLAIEVLLAAKPAPTHELSARTLRRAASAAGLTDPERVERARRARASRAKHAAG